MTLNHRHRAIVTSVAKFKQLYSSHIYEFHFLGSASATSCDRALKKLRLDGFLTAIESPRGGRHGGSGPYVYRLGRKATEFYEGRYQSHRAINYHTLDIADCHTIILRLARAGQFQVAGFSTEPDCYVKIGNVELFPDYYCELVRPDGKRRRLWLEVDRGSESQRRIKEKFGRYLRAYQAADESEWPLYQQVVFVAVDEDRARELTWLLHQGPEDMQGLFAVVQIGALSEWLQQ